MTNEELNTLLYEKILEEQKSFKDWLLAQTPEEILNHAYEYNIREDIILALEYFDLSDEKAAALLTSASPLSEIFHDFEKIESDHMETVRDCIESRAGKIVEAAQEALRCLPVYMYSAAFAKANGETEQYRTSHWANIDCKNAIEEAIGAHYSNNRLDGSCIHEVTDRFGAERVAFVLANTVQEKDWDGRISDSNKAWAKGKNVPQDKTAWGGSRTHEYSCTRTHPGLLDLFVTRFRKEYELSGDARQSVRQMLNEMKADVPKKASARTRENER